MYITLESDYAVRIIHFLAEQGVRVDAKTIAERTGVSFRFALKILRKLVAGAFVQSYKGTKGGYQLARDPAQITLRAVLAFMEGELVVSRCLLGEYPCTRDHEEPCIVQTVFKRISDQLNSEMEKINFSDLLDNMSKNT